MELVQNAWMNASIGRKPASSITGSRPGRLWWCAGRALRWVLGLLILLGAGAGRAGIWSTHHATQTAGRTGAGRGAQTPPQPVGAATIDKGDIRIILNELGTVTSLDTVTVQTQINGQLTEVGFQEGQVVKKGDFLAQIDPRPYQAALEQAQGTLAHDQGLLAQAQADLKRYQTLGRQDSIAQQQLEDQRFLVQQYTGTVQTDQGDGRQREAEPGLLPHRLADRRAGRAAPGRSRQLRPDQQHHRPRRDHPDAADLGDLLGAGGQPARHHPARARRRHAERRGL